MLCLVFQINLSQAMVANFFQFSYTVTLYFLLIQMVVSTLQIFFIIQVKRIVILYNLSVINFHEHFSVFMMKSLIDKVAILLI